MKFYPNIAFQRSIDFAHVELRSVAELVPAANIFHLNNVLLLRLDYHENLRGGRDAVGLRYDEALLLDVQVFLEDGVGGEVFVDDDNAVIMHERPLKDIVLSLLLHFSCTHALFYQTGAAEGSSVGNLALILVACGIEADKDDGLGVCLHGNTI